MYHATGRDRAAVLLEKTRPEPGPHGEGGATSELARPAAKPTPTPKPAAKAAATPTPTVQATPTPTLATARPSLGLFASLTGN